MITSAGKQQIAWAIGSDIVNNFIQYAAIGSGSGTVLVTQSTLLRETDRNPITGSPDFTESRKVTMTFDFNSVETSGLHFTEFGLLASGPSLVGSMWQIERLGSIVLDGTVELSLSNSIEVL